MKPAITLILLAFLTGCSTPWRLASDNPVPISNSFQPPLDLLVGTAIVGAAAMYVVDPLAPNWEVRTTPVDEARVEISLRKKRFSVGGDGEAYALFRRHAQDLATEAGAGGFEVLSYAEEIQSETTYARRLSRGVVRLLPPA
jgi:hypothetical protein